MSRKEYKYHYIYKITNTKNNKYYIGMHSAQELNDSYMGSGRIIRYSIKKHGIEIHTKEILEYFDDRESLRNREIELVNEELIKDPLCMNINKGGDGGWLLEWQKKGALVANKKNWADPECVKRMTIKASDTMNKRWADPQTAALMREAAAKSFLNKSHTDESKKIIGEKNSVHQMGEGNSQFGTCWIYNIELKLNKKINKNEINIYLPNKWILGRKMTF